MHQKGSYSGISERVSGFSGMGIVEWWNSGMVEQWNGFFFSLILFACVCTNYYQEYITLKQRSTIHCIGSRKYQNEKGSFLIVTVWNLHRRQESSS